VSIDALALLRLLHPARQLFYRPVMVALWPGPCLACDGSLPGPAVAGVCPACWSSLRPLAGEACPVCALPRPAYTDLDRPLSLPCISCASSPPSFDRLVAALPYSGTAVTLHRLFKFGGREEMAGPFARRMAAAFHGAGEVADLVAPVPRDPRRWKRHEPTALLARAVGRALRLPVRVRALRKVRSTPRQTHRPRLERRLGLRGAFRVGRPERLRGLRVLLVDDVATTLATVEEGARALREAGAARVTALTFGRTPLDG
jgi:predicted amidophosphoribosyltransferase